MPSRGMVVTRYCPVPYSFSPPSIVERLLRPLLPPIEKPVVKNPVKPGCWERGAFASDTPGSVYTAWVILLVMLGRSSTCCSLIRLACWVLSVEISGGAASICPNQVTAPTHRREAVKTH